MSADPVEWLRWLLGQLARELGISTRRLVATLDRVEPSRRLTYISEAFPALMDPYLAAVAQATAQAYEELPVAEIARYPHRDDRVAPDALIPAVSAGRPDVSGTRVVVKQSGFVVSDGELLSREVVASKARVSVTMRPPKDLVNLGDQLLYRQSRETMVANATAEGVKWSRHASANACGWCRMLATRGAVYGSAELAASSHPNCHCMAIPARNGLVDEAPYVAQWRKDYRQARRDGATTPGQIANAMDKAEGGRRAPATQAGGGGKPPTKPPASGKSAAGDAPEPGRVDRSKVRNVLQHELDTADRVARLGHDVEFRPPDDASDTADVFIGAAKWDFKSPTSAARGTIQKRVVQKLHTQGSNVLLDLTRSAMGFEDGIHLVDDLLRRYDGLHAVWVIKETPDGTIESTVQRKGKAQ